MFSIKVMIRGEKTPRRELSKLKILYLYMGSNSSFCFIDSGKIRKKSEKIWGKISHRGTEEFDTKFRFNLDFKSLYTNANVCNKRMSNIIP